MTKCAETTPLTIVPDSQISIEDIYDVACRHRHVTLSEQTLVLLEKGRGQLEQKIANDQLIYGVNTGFGGNSRCTVPAEQAEAHQKNLLAFLSAGTGETFSERYVRAAQLLTLVAVTRGWSAIRPSLALTLVEHLNRGIVPDIPRFGSVGASGDLIPSSYIANALCGKGTVTYNGRRMPVQEALADAGIATVTLQAKEGLALVNGTRMMTAVAALTWHALNKTFNAAVAALALTAKALDASVAHYDRRIQEVKGHPGQIAIGATLRALLASDSDRADASAEHETTRAVQSKDVVTREKEAQEIYSLRCAPQVLGVVAESLASARQVIEREAISVNDNPLIDPQNGDILHGGNFMGNHISRTMDGLKIDIALIANHMHALMALLMDSRFSKGLPDSLVFAEGIGHGFKGMQISHTALVTYIRWGSSPSGIHTLATEQFNQDIVSLGLHAAQTAADNENKLRDAVSINLLAAIQAVDLKGNRSTLTAPLAALYEAVRQISPVMREDRAMDGDIAAVSALISGDLPLPECAPR